MNGATCPTARTGGSGPRVEAAWLAIAGDAEKVVVFDRHRLVIQSLGDELAAATPNAVQQIVALLVERVETADREVVGWLPTGPTEPFFDSALLSPWRPRTEPWTRRPTAAATPSTGMRAWLDRGWSDVTDRPQQRPAKCDPLRLAWPQPCAQAAS
jgi:hypothetical protein